MMRLTPLLRGDKMRWKLLILTTALLFSFNLVSAQEYDPTTGSIPHRVYGEVTSSGAPAEDISVSLETNSQTYASDTTSSDGFYDVNVNSAEESDKIFFFVENENTSKYITFTSGASERMDHAGDYSSGDGTDSGGSDNTTSPDQGTGDDGSIGDDDSGSSDSSDSTDSGGSVGGGSGFLPPTDEEETEENSSLTSPKTVSTSFPGNTTSVSFGEVEEDQQVAVRVESSEKYLDGFSFVSDQSVDNLSVALEAFTDTPSQVKPFEDGEAFRYYRVNIEGSKTFSDGVLAYSIPKNWLSSRERSPEDVIMESYDGDSWNRHQSENVAETLSVYNFESGTAVEGFFATGITKQEEAVEQPDIQVSDIKLDPTGEKEVNVNISATLRNQGEVSGEKTVYLYRNSVIIGEKTVEIDSGEHQAVEFTDTVSKSGVYTYELEGFSEEVKVASGSANAVLIAGLLVVILLAGAFVFIYIRESRRARELDEKIQGIQNSGEGNGDRLRKLQTELNEMHRDLRDRTGR